MDTMYYLQEGLPENPNGWQVPRLFLDSRVHKWCVVVMKIPAKSWKDARSKIPG